MSPRAQDGLALAWSGPGADAPGYCNVARCAGWVVTAWSRSWRLTPQAIAMSPAARAGLARTPPRFGGTAKDRTQSARLPVYRYRRLSCCAGRATAASRSARRNVARAIPPITSVEVSGTMAVIVPSMVEPPKVYAFTSSFGLKTVVTNCGVPPAVVISKAPPPTCQ